MIRVILAKNRDEGVDCITSIGGSWVALETEYGKKTLGTEVPNVEVALNHHGDLQTQDAPALAYTKKIQKRYDNFIVSHIDLDILFGILWTSGLIRETVLTKGLAHLVALADVNGFHTIEPILSQAPKKTRDIYYAIGYLVNSWVINDNGKSITDISKEIHKLLLRIKDIIIKGASADQIKLYQEWFKEQQLAAKRHLIEIKTLGINEHMFIFRAPFRLTTAYSIGDAKATIIVQYNEQSKSITLSCFDNLVAQKYFGFRGVIEPLQKFFGEEAGGKLAIGGTSRNRDIQPEMLSGFIEFLSREYLNIPDILPVEHNETDIKIPSRVILTMKDISIKYPIIEIIKLLKSE